jgi:predicted membrane protein
MPLIYVLIALLLVLLIARLNNTSLRLPGNFRVIINIVLGLLVVGMVLWLINAYVPMAGPIKALLNIVVFLATCVGVLQALGLWASTLRWWSDFRNHRLTH